MLVQCPQNCSAINVKYLGQYRQSSPRLQKTAHLNQTTSVSGNHQFSIMSYSPTGRGGLEARYCFIDLLRMGCIYLDMYARSDSIAMRSNRRKMYGSDWVYVFDENGIFESSPVSRLRCVAPRWTGVALKDCGLELHF